MDLWVLLNEETNLPCAQCKEGMKQVVMASFLGLTLL